MEPFHIDFATEEKAAHRRTMKLLLVCLLMAAAITAAIVLPIMAQQWEDQTGVFSCAGEIV